MSEKMSEKNTKTSEKNKGRDIVCYKSRFKDFSGNTGKKTNVTSRTVERYLQVLREEGIIIRHGAARGGYWETKE